MKKYNIYYNNQVVNCEVASSVSSDANGVTFQTANGPKQYPGDQVQGLLREDVMAIPLEQINGCTMYFSYIPDPSRIMTGYRTVGRGGFLLGNEIVAEVRY